jgi:hypothetical protein
VLQTVWLEKNAGRSKLYGLTLKIRAEHASLPQTALVYLHSPFLSVIKD